MIENTLVDWHEGWLELTCVEKYSCHSDPLFFTTAAPGKTVFTNKRYSPILVSVIPLLANIGGIHRYLAILANITVFWNLAIVSLSVLGSSLTF